MGTICPICKKQGYLVREPPRKKHETQTRRGWYKENNIPYPTTPARNCGWSPHKDYVSKNRVNSEYFRIKHNYQVTTQYRKNGQLYGRRNWKTKFCYIGSPYAIIKKLELLTKKMKFETFEKEDGITTKNSKNEEGALLTYKLHPYDHRVHEWVKMLRGQTDKILEKHYIFLSDDDIKFLAHLRYLVNHPVTLMRDVKKWLDEMQQKEEERAKKLSKDKEHEKGRKTKSREKTHTRTNSDIAHHFHRKIVMH